MQPLNPTGELDLENVKITAMLQVK
jgi:hypothetical protein